MQHRIFSIGAALMLAVAATSCSDTAPTQTDLPTAPSVAKRPLGSQFSTPVSGTIAGVSSFVGTFVINSFQVVNGQLMAVGTLSGTLTDLATGAVQIVSQQALSLPVAANGSCQILHLELGPLDLNLLGLRVHLDRVVLDITAQSGPGNLLGNLLCAIANLLNSNGPLSQIADLLNQLLGLLG